MKHLLRSLSTVVFLAVFLQGCASGGNDTASAGTGMPAQQWSDASQQDVDLQPQPVQPVPQNSAVSSEWQPLRRALARDGLSGAKVDALLATLGPRLEAPMGRKMVELYRSNFLRPKEAGKPAKSDPNAVYKGVVTEQNAALCRKYLKDHARAFAQAQKQYGVPSSVAVALLFVETRLGTILKDVPENALYTLASMSQSTTLESIPTWYAKMPGYEQHRDWFAATMPKRAAWAYNETKALVRYMVANGIQAQHMPGSFYGAIGLCQFMPSNLDQYAVDGNGDGVIDLYQADDAIFSLSNFLKKHGWKAGGDRASWHAVLMRYNKSRKYANTILALADLAAHPKAAPAAAKKPGQAK